MGRDWRWENVDLRHQDAKYLARHWQGHKASAPILCRDGEGLALRFMITRKADLPEQKPLAERKIHAVALSSHVDACCCVMGADGSILARKFINFGADSEKEERLLNRMRGLREKHGESGGRKEWRLAMNMAKNHATKVASAIVAYAEEQGVDVIAFKHFYYRPKRKGSERTDIWRKNAIKDLVELGTHLHGMRVSRVCAQGVSSLAFDGSGRSSGELDRMGGCAFSGMEKGIASNKTPRITSGRDTFCARWPRQIWIWICRSPRGGHYKPCGKSITGRCSHRA